MVLWWVHGLLQAARDASSRALAELQQRLEQELAAARQKAAGDLEAAGNKARLAAEEAARKHQVRV